VVVVALVVDPGVGVVVVFVLGAPVVGVVVLVVGVLLVPSPPPISSPMP
jgi:hypothetical protein